MDFLAEKGDPPPSSAHALEAWMASSNDFFLLRRFSPLQVRCLLYLQNEIAVKSKQLDEWNKSTENDWNDKDTESHSRSHRPQFLSDLVSLLKDYSESQKSKGLSSPFVVSKTDDRNRGTDRFFLTAHRPTGSIDTHERVQSHPHVRA